jgi:MATE family multidrug resistance protein
MQLQNPDERQRITARPVGHRDVVAIALPIMLSNATVPLIGFADTVVVGQLGQAHLIGAVAVGATIFNFLYWGFGFLRMGTTGLTAQALGAQDGQEVAANLYRALLIAVGAGGAMIVAQSLIAWAAFRIMGASAEVEAAARTYFAIRIWAAPAGLVNFALLGWFIGLGRAGLAFAIQIFLNILNVALAVLFVIGLELGIPGVGAAALLAEWSAAILGLALARADLVRRGATAPLARVLDPGRMKRTFQVNTDIMIRTLCALTAFVFFMAQSARAGDLVLAANAVLNSISMVAVYLLDGFAFAAESLVGRSIGARVQSRFREAVVVSTIWAGATGALLSLGIWFAGPLIIEFMTTSAEVRSVSNVYLIWAALMPIVGVWCFQLDGIFIGATRTADMRNMMILSVVAFFAVWSVLQPLYGNHGLWMSILVFNVVRALTLLARFPALERASFPRSAQV